MYNLPELHLLVALLPFWITLEYTDDYIKVYSDLYPESPIATLSGNDTNPITGESIHWFYYNGLLTNIHFTNHV